MGATQGDLLTCKMNVSLFYKSCSKDFDYLRYSRDSVRKFCSGFSEIVLCLPEGETFDWPEAKIVNVRETFTPYMFQQAVKLFSDTWCSGDFITYQDSDTIFDKPTTPEDLFYSGKPVWITRPYGGDRTDVNVWKHPTEKFLGESVDFEGMYRHPFTVPRDVLKRIRGFCQYRHGVSLDEYIKAQCHPTNPLALVFSEWNTVAAFAHRHCPEQFHWINASKEIPSPGRVYQGFSWGDAKRKSEDIAKFKEILEPSGGAVTVVGGEPHQPLPVSVHATHGLTIPSAISFIASQVKDNFHKARIIRDLKKAWQGKGMAPKASPGPIPPPAMAIVEVPAPKKRGRPRKNPFPDQTNDHSTTTHNGNPGIQGIRTKRSGREISGSGEKVEGEFGKSILLCVHSYPGANETILRHQPYFERAGASRIVGIGTTDGGCVFPWESVNIGDNSYMKLIGPDDHLCRLLIDTIRWCLSQPEDKFIIAEYDTLFLRPFPEFSGVTACKTGDRVNGCLAPWFAHNPWGFDRASAPALLQALNDALPLSSYYPNNSPDIFFGLACDMRSIVPTCNFRMFTRNTLDVPGDLDLASQAAADGVHVIHGCKTTEHLKAIEDGLNNPTGVLSKVE